MDNQLQPIGAITRGLPREGQWLPPAERGPSHAVSERAGKFWVKLCSMYGASKVAEFGEWPPVEICKAVDSLHARDDMVALLEHIKREHEAWPPTVPQFEAIMRKHITPTVDWAKLRTALHDHIIRTRYAGMSEPQRIGIPRWNWYNDGVYVPPGAGAAGFFVSFAELQ